MTTCSAHRDETGAVLDCSCDVLKREEPVCETCELAAKFRGTEQCVACFVATCLVEDPDFLSFANRIYRGDSAWLAELNAEWTRQQQALVSSGPVPNLRVRQAS